MPLRRRQFQQLFPRLTADRFIQHQRIAPCDGSVKIQTEFLRQSVHDLDDGKGWRRTGRLAAHIFVGICIPILRHRVAPLFQGLIELLKLDPLDQMPGGDLRRSQVINSLPLQGSL